MMKTFCVPVILALFVACSAQTPAQQQTVAISDEDYETVKNLKIVSFAKAYEDQDTVLLDQILHNTYQLVDDGGEVYSKKDEMDYVSKYGPSYETFTFEILKLEVYENGTATVFGIGTITGKDIEGAYSQTYKASDVFVKENGKWQAITTHVSGVKEVRE